MHTAQEARHFVSRCLGSHDCCCQLSSGRRIAQGKLTRRQWRDDTVLTSCALQCGSAFDARALSGDAPTCSRTFVSQACRKSSPRRAIKMTAPKHVGKTGPALRAFIYTQSQKQPLAIYNPHLPQPSPLVVAHEWSAHRDTHKKVHTRFGCPRNPLANVRRAPAPPGNKGPHVRTCKACTRCHPSSLHPLYVDCPCHAWSLVGA